MIKERRLRWLGHAARRSDNNMVKQLIFAARVLGHMGNLLGGLVALGLCINAMRMSWTWDNKWVTTAYNETGRKKP